MKPITLSPRFTRSALARTFTPMQWMAIAALASIIIGVILGFTVHNPWSTQ